MLQSAIFGDLQVSSFTPRSVPAARRWKTMTWLRASFSELAWRLFGKDEAEPLSLHLRRDIGLAD